MSDHSKPIGNPPPTDIEGEQSGQDHENLTFSDIIKCCYEVDMLVQQAENRASMLRNEHGNTVPQLSDDDKQELIKLFERMSSQSQSMANSLKSYRPLPTVVPTAATHTNDLSPKVTIPNIRSSSSGDLEVEEAHNSDGLERKPSDVAVLDQKETDSDLSIDVAHTDDLLPKVTIPDSEPASSGDFGVKVTNKWDRRTRMVLDVIELVKKEVGSDLSVAATPTDDLSPKVTTPELHPASRGDLGVENDNSDSVNADNAPADDSQINVFPTSERPSSVAAAPQDHEESGQQMADIPAGSKVEDKSAEEGLRQESSDVTNQSASSNSQGNEKLYLPKIANNCLNILGEVQKMKNDTEKWKSDNDCKNENFTNNKPYSLDNVELHNLEVQNALTDTPSEYSANSQKKYVLSCDEDGVETHQCPITVVSCEEGQVVQNELNIASEGFCVELSPREEEKYGDVLPLILKSFDKEFFNRKRTLEDVNRQIKIQRGNLGCAIFVALRMMLGVVQNLQNTKERRFTSGAKRLFPQSIEKFVLYVNNDDRNCGNFNPYKFIKEQKHNIGENGKNTLFYDVLRELLDDEELNKLATQFVSFLCDQKNNEPALAHPDPGAVSTFTDFFLNGFEKNIFKTAELWLTNCFLESLKYYVMFNSYVQDDTQEIEKSQDEQWHLFKEGNSKFKLTEFFKTRRNGYKITITAKQWILKKCYDILNDFDFVCLDSDFDYLSTCPAEEVDRNELKIFHTIFSIDFQNMKLTF